jgi:hypothetical protein
VLLQSHDGNAKLPGNFPPAVKLSGSASHSEGGYVLPRLLGSRVAASPEVWGPIGENWRR